MSDRQFFMQIIKPRKLAKLERKHDIEIVLFVGSRGQFVSAFGRPCASFLEHYDHPAINSEKLPFPLAVGSACFVLIRFLHNILTGADWEQGDQ